MKKKKMKAFTPKELGVQEESVEVLAWIKSEGDLVMKNELVAVLLAEDRPLDVVSPVKGHFTKKCIFPGDLLESTSPLFEIETEEESHSLSSSQTLPAQFLFDLPIDRLSKMKEKWTLLAEKEGIALTLTPFLAKAFCRALEESPPAFLVKPSLDSSHLWLQRYSEKGRDQFSIPLSLPLEELVRKPSQKEEALSLYSLTHFDFREVGPFWTNWSKGQVALHLACSPSYKALGGYRDELEPIDHLSFSFHFDPHQIEGESILKTAFSFRQILLEPHRLIS